MRTAPLAGAALLAIALAACSGTSATPAKHHLVFVRGASRSTTSVWIADANGRSPRKLTRGFAGILSPDGRTVAVTRRDGIHLVSSDGKRERLLTSARAQHLRWTPDGKSLVVSTANLLAIVDRASGDSRVIARGPIYGFDFSPSGDRLVYARAPHRTDVGICGDQYDLYVTKLDGGAPTQLTHEGFSAFPAWGPSRIAYSRFPGATLTDCASPGIWTIDPDGSDAQPVIEQAPPELTMEGNYGLQPIAWLDDGRLLVGVRTESGTQAGVVNVGTGRLRRLRSYVVRASSDGRLFVGEGGDQELVAITRIEDGRRLFVVQDACCPDWNR